MNRKKEIQNEYKARSVYGGIYIITNTQNFRYIIGHATDIKSIQNRFHFATTTGLTVHPRLQQDWKELGAQAFKLEILEELEQLPDQKLTEFLEDLNTLEQLWRAKFDASQEY